MGGFAVPLVRAAAGAIAVLAVVPVAAFAHGPCGCLEPASGPPGTRVRAAYPIYKVIFNPDRADLTIGPESLWRSHHDGPPVTVYRQTWRYSRRPPNRGGSFVIPEAAPGRYLVALYDGGESGAHYSWETFTVTRAPAPARPEAGGGVPKATLGAAAAVALIACLAVVVGRRRRTAGSPGAG
jgi:hypothetical protein